MHSLFPVPSLINAHPNMQPHMLNFIASHYKSLSTLFTSVFARFASFYFDITDATKQIRGHDRGNGGGGKSGLKNSQ